MIGGKYLVTYVAKGKKVSQEADTMDEVINTIGALSYYCDLTVQHKPLLCRIGRRFRLKGGKE